MKYVSQSFYSKMKRGKIQLNDVLIVKDGATTGKTAFVDHLPFEAAINEHVFLVRFDSPVRAKYVAYYLMSAIGQDKIANCYKGSAIGGIDRSFAEIKIRFYDDYISTEIVKRLDLIRTQMFLLDTALEKLDQLIKSRFVEMFGSIVDNPKCWRTLPLSIAAPVNYKAFPLEGKVWQLNLDAIESMSGNVLLKTYIEAKELKGSVGGFDSSQVLYSKLRPYLNKVVVPDSSGVCTTELLPLSPLENVVDKVYLATVLRSSAFVTFANNHSNGAKMPRTDMKAFKSFELPIPPFKLQQEFANFVAQIDKLRFVCPHIRDYTACIAKTVGCFANKSSRCWI